MRRGDEERGKQQIRRDRSLHPFACLVLEERFDDGVHGVNVPGLVDEVDSSEPSWETVLRRTRGGDERFVIISIN